MPVSPGTAFEFQLRSDHSRLFRSDASLMRFITSVAALTVLASGFTHAADRTAKSDPAAKNSVLKSSESQGWLIQETASFRIFSRANSADSRRLPEACEALRRQLQETWLGNASDEWSPRCDVVLHPTVEGYVRELGPASRQSSGCTSIDIKKGQVLKRRIDLRADADDWMSSALPHELTHVVLAERFATKQIPRWADEGMAILSEPSARQAVRRSAMERALSKAPRYSAGDLMALSEYPGGMQRDAFYGQSASLVAFLIERDSPERFLEFVELSQKQGIERAIHDVYGLRSLAELDARWRPQVLDRGQSAELFAARISRITAGRYLD
jgi:hypothetical protein